MNPGEKKQATINARKIKDQENILEQLRQIPIVHICCQKAGVSRATFYRWRNESEDFAKKVEVAIAEGVQLINDLSESQLISLIKNQQMPAIAFWLKHRHQAYSAKLELKGEIKTKTEILTPEQEELILKALKLSSITDDGEKIINNNS